jgi:hypothetical protein
MRAHSEPAFSDEHLRSIAEPCFDHLPHGRLGRCSTGSIGMPDMTACLTWPVCRADEQAVHPGPIPCCRKRAAFSPQQISGILQLR